MASMPQGRPQPDKYASFAELALHEAPGKDFRVVSIERPVSDVAVIAPHGGMIEVGTSEIAALIAGADYNLFCFEGLKPHGRNRDLHLTSHLFDHPECVTLTARCGTVVSIHGCKGESCRVYLGGRDAELAGRLSICLSAAGFEVICDGHGYPGRHALNICNRGSRGMGAQLEITYGLRAPEHREAIAAAVRAAIPARPSGTT